MNSKFGAILLCLLMISKHGDSASQRQPRSLANFGDMVNQATNKNPLIFNAYGNYCGYGGGGKPKDIIDKCCETHDHCYTTTKTTGACPTFFAFLYTTAYVFEYIDGNITCKDGDFTSKLFGYRDCAMALCECDKTATECFKANLAKYDEDLKKGIIKP